MSEMGKSTLIERSAKLFYARYMFVLDSKTEGTEQEIQNGRVDVPVIFCSIAS